MSAYSIAAARGALDAGGIACVAAWVAACAGGCLAFAADEALTCVALAALSAASGVAALWLGARIAIDRRLFAALDARAQQGCIAQQLEELDRALLALGWIDASKKSRPLDDRVRGVTRLLKRSLMLAVAQWLLVGAAIIERAL
jgi:hypothetical protein